MAFVGSVSLATGANVLPVFRDAAGSSAFTLFSHLQMVIGGTVIFDSRPAVTITGVAGSVIAIPPAARNVTLGTATALLGKMD